MSEAELLSPEERRRVLSTTRLKFTLTLFVVGVLLGLSAMIFSGVGRIFDWLMPSIRADLEHKAVHGAFELAQTAQLGMVLSDPSVVAGAVSEYVRDADVVGMAVTSSTGVQLFNKGQFDNQIRQLFTKPANRVQDLGNMYGAWVPSLIEGTAVGRVGVLVSKARLDAGMSLREDILMLAAAGCGVAFLACLVFVSLYIAPILRMTAESFVRLEKTTEAALAATRLKSQFLANMSHEIRTPMNGIIGVTELLNRTGLNPKQQRYTQTIETSARGLLTIINDVLDFSKLEAGKYDVRLDDFEVTQLIHETTELLSPKAHAKQLEVIVRSDENVPSRVRGDIDRIKQILINLLGNAIKFTEHGYVELHVSVADVTSDHSVLRFAVKDTGLGIRPEDQSKLFGTFSQVDGSLTRKYGGTGLGLAICKRIAGAMGGDIGVQSELGQGSTFWFTARVAHAERMTEILTPRREAAVLLVTASEAQRIALSELIQRWGMSCEVATTPELACEAVINHPGGFTAAVIDSGTDAASFDTSGLLDMCVGEGLPVIRLLSTTQVASDSLAPELQTFLWKPVRASELYNGIVAVLDGNELVLRRRGGEQQDSKAEELGGGHGRVLVVDDNEINRLVAVELLTELGYRSDTACNGREAFEKVEAGNFHVVLMDCQMPEVDGFQATALIRQLPNEKARTPIIALTAHAMADDRDRVLRAGMDDYASKPVRGRVLSGLLERWVPTDATASIPPQAQASSCPPHLSSRPDAPHRSPAPLAAAEADAQVLDPTLPRSKRAVELFLKTVPELVQTLQQAVDRREPSNVKQLAHKLKGNCLSLGANRMAAACHAVELAAQQGQIDVDSNRRIGPHLALATPLLAQLLAPQPSNDVKAPDA